MYREFSVLYVVGTELNKIERKGLIAFKKRKRVTIILSLSLFLCASRRRPEYSVGVHLSVGTTRRRAGDAQRSPVAHTHTHKPSASFLPSFFFFFVEIIICWRTVRMLQRARLLLWGFHVFPGKR